MPLLARVVERILPGCEEVDEEPPALTELHRHSALENRRLLRFVCRVCDPER